MPKVNNYQTIPTKSLVGSEFESFDYFDSYSVSLNNQRNWDVDHFFREFGNFDRGWIIWLMRLRNFLVRFAGLKPGKMEKENLFEKPIKAGKLFGPFRILTRNENEIVFYENDKHLNFRSSILLLRQNEKQHLYSITVVHFNNALGRIYFFFVKPFHKMIVKSMLKRISTNI